MVLWGLFSSLPTFSPFPTVCSLPSGAPHPHPSEASSCPWIRPAHSHLKALPCPFYLLFRVAGWFPNALG